MPNFICIDSATNVCSVTLVVNDKVVCSRESHEDRNHASLLTPFIDQCFKESQTDIKKYDFVCINKGPGSYTGLRIGTAAAKALAYSGNLKLIAIDSLRILFYALKQKHPNLFQNQVLFFPMLDARRMEVYTCVFDQNGNRIHSIDATIMDINSFNNRLKSAEKAVFFGNGASKYKTTIKDERLVYIDQIHSSSLFMAQIVLDSIKNNTLLFEDFVYFEPLYLKEFAQKKA
ncbi:MAG TPA: tRNA (adenosine(37)-N6)-threonylcarbamoyltransferase complex dimerization subunit type 1 TsaB [Bacteroidia bacterium]|nr:tRNA (adenosine(37)-N6)-threonylcarbamoyltransferase complex dimerization subunit type 1 TsaB [Bacteroidia bacterium]HNT79366.1 tRNA (adenosine(37)-N6)-threonylcarbamoyltransferase complex dimerization subunit type 1 TsaB [Bacteroidia bacterium]